MFALRYEKTANFPIDFGAECPYTQIIRAGKSLEKEWTMMEDTYYLIRHLVLFTGLSDRTIRHFIASGILRGERINGLWHFTPEQVEDFLRNPAVRPGLRARRNASVHDFLLDTRRKAREACIILDLPGRSAKEVSEFFYYRIHTKEGCGLRFSMYDTETGPRIILKGDAAEALRLVNEYEQA